MTDEVRAVILAGVSGAGKSTVGPVLAGKLGWLFWDTNFLHSEENIAKMRRSEPLEDKDRWPWLADVRILIDKMLAERGTGVFECSALKKEYREYLLGENHDEMVALIAVDRDVAHYRVAARVGDYFPPTLVDSQFAVLENIQDSERGITVDGNPPRRPDAIADVIIKELGLHVHPGTEIETS